MATSIILALCYLTGYFALMDPWQPAYGEDGLPSFDSSCRFARPQRIVGSLSIYGRGACFFNYLYLPLDLVWHRRLPAAVRKDGDS